MSTLTFADARFLRVAPRSPRTTFAARLARRPSLPPQGSLAAQAIGVAARLSLALIPVGLLGWLFVAV